MKVLERLLLAHQSKQVNTILDPRQFAYPPEVGAEDAIIYLLQRASSHLDKADSTVRIVFFDFTSDFNAIQPVLLHKKLQKIQVDAYTTTCITDCLTNRPHFVRLKCSASEKVVSTTGAPQGTVLLSFPFTLYTLDYQENTGVDNNTLEPVPAGRSL